MDPRSMDQRREFDALLDREWTLAVEQADRRLAGASGPLDCIGGAEPMVIRRGRGGKLKLVKAGGKRWSRPVEERFFAVLATCGTIAAAARAVGFSESCISHRRRKWPDFAQRLEEALEDAEVEVEFRMAAEVRGCGRGGEGGQDGGAGQSQVTVPEPFDMDAAMRFLKWREEKRHGRGRRGRIPALPSIEAVTAKIIREVEAIKRQRARRERHGSGGTGGSDDAA